MQTMLERFVVSRNGVPTNGAVAFRNGETRNHNPFNYKTEFNQWLQWDTEWYAAKILG
jgi:hypothetical protein